MIDTITLEDFMPWRSDPPIKREIIEYVFARPGRRMTARSVSNQLDSDITPRMVATILCEYSERGYVEIIRHGAGQGRHLYRWRGR